MDNKQYYMQVMYADDDDSDSFCRVPESDSSQLVYRLPYSSISSLTLTESGDCASAPNRCNNSSDEQQDEHKQQQEEISDKHSTSKLKEENCCGGSVLHGILTFISPEKKKKSNALSLSYEELMNGHPSASSFKTSESCQQLGGFDSGDTWASPSGVNNFPYQTPLPTFPKELFPEPPLNHQEHQQHEEEDSGSTNLQQYIIAASQYEEESRFDDAVSSLEEYLQQQQSQNLSDTCFAQAHSRATALHKLGVLHWKLGRHFFSEHVLLDCMYTYQNILDTNPSDQQLVFESAQVLASLGRLHSSKGDEESARDFHNKALETFKQVLQSKEVSDELRVDVLNSIASSYAATSRLDKALKYHEKEVRLRSKLTPYHICVARLYLHMSKIAMRAVDCNGEYSYLDKVDTWLEEADEVYCHQEGLVSESELMSLESIMEEYRRRRME